MDGLKIDNFAILGLPLDKKQQHFAVLEESHVVTHIKGVVLCAVAIFDSEVEVQVERQIPEVKRLE